MTASILAGIAAGTFGLGCCGWERQFGSSNSSNGVSSFGSGVCNPTCADRDSRC